MTAKEQYRLKALRDIAENLSHFSFEQFKYAVHSVLPKFPIICDTDNGIRRILKNGSSSVDPSILFRARLNKVIPKGSTMKFPFQTMEEIGLVPEAFADTVPIGRCNKAKERRFYCSNYSITACLETLSKGFTSPYASDTVTLGAWKIQKSLNLAKVLFSLDRIQELGEMNQEVYQRSINSYNRIADYTKAWKSHLLETFDGMNDSPDFLISVFEFFSNQFGRLEIQSERDYWPSILYTDVIFDHSTFDDEGALFDGLMYPSIRNALQEWNLVLHPRALHKLSFVSAEQVWITKHGGGKIQFDSLDNSGVDTSGDLDWSVFKM